MTARCLSGMRETHQPVEVIELDPAEIFLAQNRRGKALNLTDEKDQYFIENIQRVGFLQPVTVRKLENGPKPYELVFGRRRLAVAKHLEIPIPAKIAQNVSDAEMAFFAVSENACRQQLEYAQHIKL